MWLGECHLSDLGRSVVLVCIYFAGFGLCSARMSLLWKAGEIIGSLFSLTASLFEEEYGQEPLEMFYAATVGSLKA
ncbi:hypothetical protein Nepgr_006345 [Nepenthes gracilis]|uniref:Uncharacterized protein n=1 Tax=Nepenthes gracilis TaxID=150966 RepID=A0AAD3S5C4_NEPGR|nr:hypothetical protein Nepgr_006345 [Nepenthes gracilis]